MTILSSLISVVWYIIPLFVPCCRDMIQSVDLYLHATLGNRSLMHNLRPHLGRASIGVPTPVNLRFGLFGRVWQHLRISIRSARRRNLLTTRLVEAHPSRSPL